MNMDEEGTKTQGIKPRPAGGAAFAPVTKKPKEREDILDKLKSQQTGPGKTASKEQTKPNERTGEKVGAEPRRHRSMDQKPGDRHKRRAVVYHEDGQGGGSATSDEYKRRMHEARERAHEEIQRDDESENFLKIVAAALALVIVLSLSVLIHLYLQTNPPEENVMRYTSNLEVMRYQFAAMSEVLDCSLYMRRRATLNETPHGVLRQGLMCLYALAPHTVHERSAMFMTILHRYTIAQFIDEYADGTLLTGCSQKAYRKSCNLLGMAGYMNGLVHINGTIAESQLVNAWAEYDTVDPKYNAAVWSREAYENVTVGESKIIAPPRKFRVPKLLVRLAKNTSRTNKGLAKWEKRFGVSVKNLTAKTTIEITKKEAKHAAEKFSTSKVTPQSMPTQLSFDSLEHNPATITGLDIVYPKNGTKSYSLSFMSAFIVKVVYEAFTQANPKYAEISLQMMSLNAQKLALHYFRQSREWSGRDTDSPLMSFKDRAVSDVLRQTFDKGVAKVYRNGTDRVTTVMLWERTKAREWFTLIEMCTPTLFHSTDSSGRAAKYAPFIDVDGHRSTFEYRSAAGITIFRKYSDYYTPILSVSASGTERTVEGVANAALRVLLLKEAAGDAVRPEPAYLEPRDGKLYCTQIMNAMLQEKFDRTCDVLNVKHPDRRVMIADGTTQAPQIVLAMTQAYGEYNYATGY
ncbi:hypothetical protein Q1695_009904 [Nippostrongylus brasiliensis]|nr:hypothetical protein Q1695_009904 [Nippostrongylus brasiliensis]